MKPTREHLAGAVVGAAVGEALGMPLKFAAARPETPVNRYLPGGEFGGICGNLKAGQWTDGAQALIMVLESLLNRGKTDPADIRGRFRKWAVSGKSRVPGSAFRSAAAAGTAARTEDAAPIVLAAPLAFLVEEKDAVEICKLTHDSADCVRWMTGIYRAASLGHAEAKKFFKRESAGWSGSNTGWVTDTGMCALKAALETDNFKDAVVMAANCGGNSDAIGAVAGGLAGAWHTFSSIPEEFLFTLESGGRLRRLSDMVFEQFIERFSN